MPSDEELHKLTVIQLCELIEDMATLIKKQQELIEMTADKGL